jgi:MYXO-CTERM domain-containing protein
MSMNLMTSVTAAAGLVSCAAATPLPFSTGFEASQGYVSGSQIVSNPNWTGDGQDTVGITVTSNTVGGSGAASGSQWLLMSAPTPSVASRFAWPVTPVTNFSTLPVIVGSADVKLVSPASGVINRTSNASISMWDAAVNRVAGMSLVMDVQHAFGSANNEMYIQFINADGSHTEFDLGVANDLNHYYHLELSANFATGTFTGSVNGVTLPFVGSIGSATDFHDFDIDTDILVAQIGGGWARAGFDNFSIAQVPTPGAAALAGIAGGALVRRRRR